MNNVINKFLLAGEKFMAEMHYRQPGKACFQCDMVYGDFKDLLRRTASDKVLCDRAFKIASVPKYDRYQPGLELVY